MGKFDGKRLLMLGTSIGSVDMVKYAKSEGAYVIVTDYLPVEKSEAKRYADETAMLSTIDHGPLVEFAKEKKIDGVFCGVSEPNLLSVHAIAEALGLPCYFNLDQWAYTEHKAKFKELCEKNGVPVAKRYKVSNIPTEEELANVTYPCVVKPVDRSSSIGIHICKNREELIAGAKDAYKKSFEHNILVEEFIEGDEFNATYTVINGKCRLSLMYDRFFIVDGTEELKGFPPLSKGMIFPSKYLNAYLEQVNDKVIKMIESIGYKNGVFFAQGMAKKGGGFALFEAALRMAGSATYRIIEKINGINIANEMIDYALLGHCDGDIGLEDPFLKGKFCCKYNVVNRGGVIGSISGFDEACKAEGVFRGVSNYEVGDKVLVSGTLKHIQMTFYMLCDSVEQIKRTCAEIDRLVSVKDTDGNEMTLQLPSLDIMG